MSEQYSDPLGVDAREEAYLRRAFRRFALPYLLGMLALVVGLWFLAKPGPPPREGEANAPERAAPTDDLRRSVVERMDEIEVRMELDRAEARTTQRSLQDRISAVESRPDASQAARDALEQALHAQIAGLERRLAAREAAQTAALPAAAAP